MGSNHEIQSHEATGPVIENFAERWTCAFSKGEPLEPLFNEFWKTLIPHVFSKVEKPWPDWALNEDIVSSHVVTQFQNFIYGSNTEILESISANKQSPSVCAKNFKSGEATYNCRECGTDPTCVLCAECFLLSAHRNHKYRLATSNGGGCCDCGDVEAWKTEPYCGKHQHLEFSPQEPKIYPEAFIQRVIEVYRTILQYSLLCLTIGECTDLPRDLQVDETCPEISLNTLSLIIYNDEIHTFEQVSDALISHLQFNKKDAIDFASHVDRNGRAAVCCSNKLQDCCFLKGVIKNATSSRQGRPLTVQIVPTYVLLHQLLCLRMIDWIAQMNSVNYIFRKVFCDLVTQPALPNMPQESCILEEIIVWDSRLWKSARNHWHSLILSGMFLEYQHKRDFAIVFNRKYVSLMRDFIYDDHDHLVSILSFSVQIYTVPSIAWNLIANQNALSIMLEAFFTQSLPKVDSEGKLMFPRTVGNIYLKRAIYILYDLRYILNVHPTIWDPKIRSSFQNGMTSFLKLLYQMQGMDSVVRQISNHVEYDTDWGTAFSIQHKMIGVISNVFKWCASDGFVLTDTYRQTMEMLAKYFVKFIGNATKKVGKYSAKCSIYDGSLKPVSFHYPLSRFFAGLYLLIEDSDLSCLSIELLNNEKVNPKYLIETALLTQVLIAQTHAGMWRRNGDSITNQIYFYYNVKWRKEMLDKDIVLLQMGASMMDSNEFLIHLLNKFGLLKWATADFDKYMAKADEETVRKFNTVGDDFLRLLIAVNCERYVEGVGEVTQRDIVKKEVIHQLCIKPFSHSELNKNLYEDNHHETGLDEVINEVADFKVPSGLSKGVYVLKPHLHSMYHTFHYHYSKEDQSKSEEEQRKFNLSENGIDCCPPPPFPKFKNLFKNARNFLNCDVMMIIFSSNLKRAIDCNSKCFSDSQFNKLLYLMGCALNEEISNPNGFGNFIVKADRYQIRQLLQDALKNPKIEANEGLIKWVINRFQSIIPTNSNHEVTNENILLAHAKRKETHDNRSKIVAERRAKIMAQMTALQNSFIQGNPSIVQYLDEAKKEIEEESSELELNHQLTIFGPYQTPSFFPRQNITCILCQETEPLAFENKSFVLAAFLQLSNVLHPDKGWAASQSPTDELSVLKDASGPSPHLSTCGHAMHASCWQVFFNNVMNNDSHRHFRMRVSVSYDPEKSEYLCPLCERLSNTILPIVPAIEMKARNADTASTKEVGVWLKQVKTLLADCELFSVRSKTSPEDATEEGQIIPLGESGTPVLMSLSPCATDNEVTPDFLELVNNFVKSVFDVYIENEVPDHSRNSLPVQWVSCAYTIRTIEHTLTLTKKPLLDSFTIRQEECLKHVIRNSALMVKHCSDPLLIRNYGLEILKMVIVEKRQDSYLMSWDCFNILVALSVSLPSKLQVGPQIVESSDFNFLQIMFYAVIAQLIFVYQTNSLKSNCTEKSSLLTGTTNETSKDEIKAESVAGCSKAPEKETDILKSLGFYLTSTEVNDTAQLWAYLQEKSKPFLRCCCIFYSFLYGVPAPEPLKLFQGDGFADLCGYLGLPVSCQTLFDHTFVFELFTNWSVKKGSSDLSFLRRFSFPELIPLPTDYTELINTASLFTCPNSNSDGTRNPAMCLVCGTVLCSHTYCCQVELNRAMVGACTFHAHSCGAGVGIFLRIRECEVLFLSTTGKGWFAPAPYLDIYGETDYGLRRGNPLYLSKEHYKKIQLSWMSHEIYEDISRAIESSQHHINMQWELL